MKRWKNLSMWKYCKYGAIHKGCPHIRQWWGGEGGGSDKSGCPLFNRECMEHNVKSFRILPSLECFLHYFQTRITATKFE